MQLRSNKVPKKMPLNTKLYFEGAALPRVKTASPTATPPHRTAPHTSRTDPYLPALTDSAIFSYRATSHTPHTASPQVSNLMRKLAPLNYSASAPATLREEEDPLHRAGTGDPLTDVELNARPGSGRIVLEDDISQAASAKRSRCVCRPRGERSSVSTSRRLMSKVSSTNQSMHTHIHILIHVCNLSVYRQLLPTATHCCAYPILKSKNYLQKNVP